MFHELFEQMLVEVAARTQMENVVADLRAKNESLLLENQTLKAEADSLREMVRESASSRSRKSKNPVRILHLRYYDSAKSSIPLPRAFAPYRLSLTDDQITQLIDYGYLPDKKLDECARIASPLPYGGVTIANLNNRHFGIAICSRKDVFNKERGRQIALERAFQAQFQDKPVVCPLHSSFSLLSQIKEELEQVAEDCTIRIEKVFEV